MASDSATALTGFGPGVALASPSGPGSGCLAGGGGQGILVGPNEASQLEPLASEVMLALRARTLSD